MSRRGVAMVIALLTMMVVITSVAIIARVRTTHSLVRSDAARGIQINDLLSASDAPVRAWLADQAGSLTLPSDVDAPMVELLNDKVTIGRTEGSINISAWDQSGMYPRSSAEIGIETPFDHVNWIDSALPGIDEAASRAAFPSIKSPAAMGGMIATHNPWPSASGSTRARGGAQININTAPRPLIEAVFGRLNLGDPEWMFGLRDKAEMAFVTGQIVREDRLPIQIVSVSRVWSFRIDIELDTIRRSYWCVYANQGGNWRLVQRLVID
jgi:hypothetical protein